MADVRFSDLWQATVEAIRSDFVYFVGFIVALTAIWVANDILMPDSLTLGSIGSAIITIVGQSVMIRRHLQRAGISSAASLADGRYIAVFGISFLTGLGILAGIILLVIPGLFLAARWFLSVPAMFAENSGVTEGIGSSWRASEAHFFQLLTLMLLTAVPMLIVFVFLWVETNPEQPLNLVESFLGNLAVAVTTVTGWLAAVSSYHVIKGGDAQAREIFG